MGAITVTAAFGHPASHRESVRQLEGELAVASGWGGEKADFFPWTRLSRLRLLAPFSLQSHRPSGASLRICGNPSTLANPPHEEQLPQQFGKWVLGTHSAAVSYAT